MLDPAEPVGVAVVPGRVGVEAGREAVQVARSDGGKTHADVAEAARIMGLLSAKKRLKKWGKHGFAARMSDWGKLGGWPKGRPRKKSGTQKRGKR